MTKKFLLMFVFFLFSVHAFGQKILVWCPPTTEIGTGNDKLRGINLNIVFSDLRKITDTTRVECSSQDIINHIAQGIMTSYPSAIINILDTTQFHSPAEKNKITVRIAITAYHSASGTDASSAIGNSEGDFSWGALPKNKWNSVAGFHVVIEDNRTETSKTLTRNIANIVSRPNIGGSLTAKKALFEAYNEANRELLYFIESTIQPN